MKISQPIYSRVPYDFQGMSLWKSFVYILKNPPSIKLEEDFVIILDDGAEIVIPKGFVIDGASVPRILWVVPGFSPYGPLLPGAIAHDFGYQHGFLLMRYSEQTAHKLIHLPFDWDMEKIGPYVPVYIGRKQDFFDKLLKHVVIEANGASVVAGIAYAALKRFGHKAWKNYRKKGPGAYNNNSLNLPGVRNG